VATAAALPVLTVPVHTEDGRVVFELVVGLLEDAVGQRSDRLPRMEGGGFHDRLREVDADGVAFEHAVGWEHHAVAGLQVDSGRAVSRVTEQAEREICRKGQRHGLRPSDEVSLDVAGIDEFHRPAAQVDPANHSGHEVLDSGGGGVVYQS
jgi:hypothetical protein